MTNAEKAEWISRKDDCCAFQDIARALLRDDVDEARRLIKAYEGWLSPFEKKWFREKELL